VIIAEQAAPQIRGHLSASDERNSIRNLRTFHVIARSECEIRVSGNLAEAFAFVIKEVAADCRAQ
jgi:hypothetical protein